MAAISPTGSPVSSVAGPSVADLAAAAASIAMEHGSSDGEDAEVDSMLPVAPAFLPKPRFIDLTQLPPNHQTAAQLRAGYNAFIQARTGPAPSPKHRKGPRSQKQRHFHPYVPAAATSRPVLASPLGNLPVELLTEVFAFVRPTDLTAIALTCTYFRRFLMNDEARVVWRRTRHNTVPVTPDPLEGMSEHEYCRILFGWAPCEICTTLTNRIPISFSLRAKLCKSPLCGKTLAAKLQPFPAKDRPMLWIAPAVRYLEKQIQHPTSRVRDDALRRLQSTGQPAFIRRGTFEPILADYMQDIAASSETAASLQWLTRLEPLRRIQQSWDRLISWASMFEEHERTVVKSNDRLVRERAKAMSWDKRDVYNSPTMIGIVRAARLEGHVLTKQEVEPSLPKIKVEVERLRDARAHRANVAAQTRALAEMNSLHAFLVTSRRHPLPPVQEFKLLPAIQTVINTGSPKAALDKNTVIANVESELQHWAERARHQFGRLLPRTDEPEAMPATIAAAAYWVHPAERLDTLFMCMRCEDVEASKAKKSRPTWRAMTCSQACLHTCSASPSTSKSKPLSVLSTGQFVWDDRASRAAAIALRAIGADASIATQDDLKSLHAMFRCSVDGCSLTMPFSRVASHALRHVNFMDLDVVDDAGPGGVIAPYVSLFDRDGKEIVNTIVTCRHCRTMVGTPGSVRAHIQSKHGVARFYCADEDFGIASRDTPPVETIS